MKSESGGSLLPWMAVHTAPLNPRTCTPYSRKQLRQMLRISKPLRASRNRGLHKYSHQTRQASFRKIGVYLEGLLLASALPILYKSRYYSVKSFCKPGKTFFLTSPISASPVKPFQESLPKIMPSSNSSFQQSSTQKEIHIKHSLQNCSIY